MVHCSSEPLRNSILTALRRISFGKVSIESNNGDNIVVSLQNNSQPVKFVLTSEGTNGHLLYIPFDKDRENATCLAAMDCGIEVLKRSNEGELGSYAVCLIEGEIILVLVFLELQISTNKT